MSRAIVITVNQSKALEMLYRNGTVTASDFDRSVLEQLVARSMAIKHHNGSFVSYSLSAFGKTVYKSL